MMINPSYYLVSLFLDEGIRAKGAGHKYGCTCMI